MHPLDRFREVVLCDFEFVSQPGERQIPVCMVAWELRSGRKLRIWKTNSGRRRRLKLAGTSLPSLILLQPNWVVSGP